MSDKNNAKTPRDLDAKTGTQRTRIKICGLRDVEAALHAAACGADLLGLNFVERSPRYVDPTQAKVISAALREQVPGVEPVGLFCNHELAFVREVAEACELSVVQLHGDEMPGEAAALGGLRVYKAVPFEAARIEAWRDAPANVEAMLVDTPHAADDLTGGSGRTFDWSALAEMDRRGLPPVMLAGGLTPANVGEAIRTVRTSGSLWGVDVSSGVESSRGVKDPAKIAVFCDAVRAADAAASS